MSLMGGDDLTIHARVDNDASAELRDIRGELRTVGTQAQRSGRLASASSRGYAVMGRAGRLAATGVKLAFGATLVAGYAAVRLLKSSFSEAREAQKVGATTAAIIKATGGAAKISEKQVGKLATRLSNMAGIDDELIQSGANLLLTFKNVRNEAGKGNKVFNRATAAAVDLSAAGFGSVESGSKMLGKALNDPLKGITALSRAGVTFTAQQQDQIKTLVGQNDLLGAQRIILGEVEHQVGGVAKAQATWGDKAAVSWGNAQEALGTALLPVLDRVSRWFVEKGAPQLDKWVGIFEDKGIPALGRFGRKAEKLGRDILPTVKDVLSTIADVVSDVAPKLVDVFKAFHGLPGWAKQAVIMGAGGAAVAKKLGVLSLGKKAVTAVVGSAKPVPVIVMGYGPGALAENSIATGAAGAGVGAGVAAGSGAAAAAAAYAAKAASALKWGGGWLAASTAAGGGDVQKYKGLAITGGEVTTPKNVGTAADFDKLIAGQRSSLTGLLTDTATTFGGASGAVEVFRTKVQAGTDAVDVLKGQLRVKLKPQVDPGPFDVLRGKVDDLKATLRGFDGVTYTANATLDTSAAYTALARLRSAAAYGAQAGVPNAARTGMEPRAYGGRVIKGRSYLVGERRAETFTPDRSGWIKPRAYGDTGGGGGGITIEAGAVVVDASGASSNVDVAQAVADGIETFLREREERA